MAVSLKKLISVQMDSIMEEDPYIVEALAACKQVEWSEYTRYIYNNPSSLERATSIDVYWYKTTHNRLATWWSNLSYNATVVGVK